MARAIGPQGATEAVVETTVDETVALMAAMAPATQRLLSGMTATPSMIDPDPTIGRRQIGLCPDELGGATTKGVPSDTFWSYPLFLLYL